MWLVILVVIGAGLAYGLILWFRSTAEHSLEETKIERLGELASPVALAPENVTAMARVMLMSGENIGTVSRVGTIEIPEYSLLVTLPALMDDSTYEIWMVKEGLADVKSVGILDARADGTWAKTFTLADPLQYPKIVIMREPADDKSEPSGNIVAEGVFE